MSGHEFRLSFSNKAFDDLNNIQTYTEITYGSLQKEIYEEKLKEGFAKIASMPGIGHRHKYLKEDLRVFNIEKHLVIYQVHEEKQEVVILRILHKNSDRTSLF
ncbi:MAG: type II toxin-antitoxin system RelE/ParE family toxin [Saprospiraceae bacterium]|nr:type II toxin-antitoxin system RelE/ParE family toxin [Saprospiraceae bacterium]